MKFEQAYLPESIDLSLQADLFTLEAWDIKNNKITLAFSWELARKLKKQLEGVEHL